MLFRSTQTIAGTYTLQCIGRYFNATGGNAPYQWDGLISDSAVWSRALTPNEVRSLYQLGRGGMLERRRRRRYYSMQADVVKSYLFVNRGQVIGGGVL